jgi:uncharacterized protein (TIGR02145 family)
MLAILFAVFSVFFTNCKEDEDIPKVEQDKSAGSFTDSRDGYFYKTVKIGEQVWMAENLRYLPDVVSPGTGSGTISYYYVYDYNGTSVSEAKATDNFSTYGVLYNWTAACSSCPSSWHLPSDAEWAELIEYLGGKFAAHSKLKDTGTTHWDSPNGGATNESGFTALPGGERAGGDFCSVGNGGFWWSATKDEDDVWYRIMYYDNTYVHRMRSNGELGLSVRCVKD